MLGCDGTSSRRGPVINTYISTVERKGVGSSWRVSTPLEYRVESGSAATFPENQTPLRVGMRHLIVDFHANQTGMAWSTRRNSLWR